MADSNTEQPGNDMPAAPDTTSQATPVPRTNNKPGTKIMAAYLIIVSGLLIWWFICIQRDLSTNNSCYAVSWENTDTLCLKSGPSWFIVDNKSDSIKSLKVIDDEDKKKLLALYTGNDSCSTYPNAIDQLAFKSNKETSSRYYMILLLTGVCGMMGVMLRTINNFIGVACYKVLDLEIWWPYYTVRPCMGFFIGPILYSILDGKLLTIGSGSTGSNVYLIAITILAGYGTEDFLDMLKNLSKRLFRSNDAKNYDKPDEKEKEKEKKDTGKES